MIVIDASKKLGQNSMREFVRDQSDDTLVTMFIEPQEVMFEKPISHMRKFFEDELIESVVDNDECVISFITDTKLLRIVGLDYRWWIAVVRNKKYRRLDRLFATESNDKIEIKQEKQSKIETHMCKVANATEDGYLDDVAEFIGNMKDMIAFINKEYQIRQIRSFFKAKVMYCIDEDETNAESWHSYEDLVERGVFVK